MAEMGKPLRLKDLLELDCDSCSAAGFRCYPRRLGESSPSPMSLRFCRSPSSLRRPGKLSHISRSLSRQLKSSFRWHRRNDEEEVVVDAAVSGCGCEPEYTSPSESSDSSGSRSRAESSDSELSSASSSSSSAPERMHAAAVPKPARDEHEDGTKKKEEGSISGSEADDKEQLSPVAVMDFPCFDDDAGLCSPSLDDNMRSGVQTGGRNKTRKIRRFGSIDELVPLNLQARLAVGPDTEDHDDAPVVLQLTRHADETTPPSPSSRHHGVRDELDAHADGLFVLLVDTVSTGRLDAVSERLLLDFFVEMKVEGRAQHRVPREDGLLRRKQPERSGNDDGEILAAARGWLLDGAGAKRWGLEDVLRGGEAVVSEMERVRRWMQVGQEQREVATMVVGVLADQLVDELVRDFLL